MKEKIQEKQVPTTADRQNRRSLATAASTGDRPPSSKTPKRRYQSTPPRRDATMTTLLPRVSLDTRRGEREASPNALQEGPAAPSGATASVSAKPTGISPDLNLYLRHSGARHQTDHHPAPNPVMKLPTLSHHGTPKPSSTVSSRRDELAGQLPWRHRGAPFRRSSTSSVRGVRVDDSVALLAAAMEDPIQGGRQS